MTGRRKDCVWNNFNEIHKDNQKRAKCKFCNLEIVPLVARMRQHLIKSQCNQKRSDGATEKTATIISDSDSDSSNADNVTSQPSK